MIVNIKKAYVFFLCVYLISLPLSAMSIGALGSGSKLIALLPVLLAVTRAKRVYINTPIKLYFIYIVICGISVLYSLDTTLASSKFWSLLLLFLLLASSCCFSFNSRDTEKLKQALVWSSRISCLLCLMFNNFVEGRLSFQNGVFSEDQNYFCAYLAFGIIYAVEKLLDNEAKKRHKIIALIEVVVYLSVALLTGSRGGMIALLFGIVLFILLSNNKVISLKTIFTVAIISIALYIGTQFLSDDILSRFTFQNVRETGGTGRTVIWSKALYMFKQSSILRKMFGQGIGNTITAWSHYGIYEMHVCHNMFIESLIEIGLVGLVAYTSTIFSFMKSAFYRQKYAFGVIVVMFFLSLSTSISTFKPYINIMLYILCLINCEKDANM